MSLTRIILVDDHTLFRKGLAELLEQSGSIEVTAFTGNPDEVAMLLKAHLPDVLILDDFGMRKLTATEAQDLCEILEERSFGKATVFTTQLPLDHWAEVIADPVIADAIRDRLQHAALTLTITGESYRGVRARKLAGSHKDK